MSIGQSVAPSAEIIFQVLAKEFGKFPWEVADAPVEDVMRAWILHCEMQPRELNNGR